MHPSFFFIFAFCTRFRDEAFFGRAVRLGLMSTRLEMLALFFVVSIHRARLVWFWTIVICSFARKWKQISHRTERARLLFVAWLRVHWRDSPHSLRIFGRVECDTGLFGVMSGHIACGGLFGLWLCSHNALWYSMSFDYYSVRSTCDLHLFARVVWCCARKKREIPKTSAWLPFCTLAFLRVKVICACTQWSCCRSPSGRCMKCPLLLARFSYVSACLRLCMVNVDLWRGSGNAEMCEMRVNAWSSDS